MIKNDFGKEIINEYFNGIKNQYGNGRGFAEDLKDLNEEQTKLCG